MTSTHHKSLNSKQLDILQLLYRFRFGTTELIAQALDIKTKNKMNERLKILLDQEYIGRNYEPEYRLLRKHATYYLLPRGIKTLKEDDKYDEAALHNTYKDKAASEQFIRHCLTIFRVYCELRAKHGNSLRFFTKNQLTKFEYFPAPLPDAYIRLKIGDKEKQYFLEVLQSTRPFFVNVRKARRYITYADEREWETTNTALPTVLLICDSDTLQKRLEKHLAGVEDIDEDLRLLVITNAALVLL